MFIFSKYIYKFIFWLYTQLHINYLTLDKVPKFLGFTIVDIGLFVSLVVCVVLTFVLLFRFTKFKMSFVFGSLAILLAFVFVYSNHYYASSIVKRFDIVKKVYPKKVYMKTNIEKTTKTLKLNDTITVKNIKGNVAEVYDSYKKESNNYTIDTFKYVDKDGKTVKVSEENRGAFDEKASEIIKKTTTKTKSYYFNESLAYEDIPEEETQYTVIIKLDAEQVEKAKKLEKQIDKDKKTSENAEKFFE